MRIIVLAGPYSLGAIPCAVLVARSRGVDIRSVGSGNPGAHNVMHQVGQFWGWQRVVSCITGSNQIDSNTRQYRASNTIMAWGKGVIR
ncbi:MAG TPA: glycerol-3-phosphate acyltransferase [Anaerolineae bacterium]|nr:glycerol-3-phosphate acyltransferase [Anaerolineae bacterium]